jgi:hypothetical protein
MAVAATKAFVVNAGLFWKFFSYVRIPKNKYGNKMNEFVINRAINN